MILKSSVLVLQMDKFRQISKKLWPLIDFINWFSLSIFGVSLPIFFKLCMKRSNFKMIFFALKLSRGGYVACLQRFYLTFRILVSFKEQPIICPNKGIFLCLKL